MLSGEKNGERLVLAWIKILVWAGRCNSRGRLMLTNDIPYNIKTLSKELGFSEKTLEHAFEQFVRLNMITAEDGVYSVVNWEEDQNVEGMERVREQNRNRKRAQRSRDRHVTVTESHATEEEGEEDKEKELEYSFNQSCKSSVDFDENVEKSVENRRTYLQGTLGQGVVFLSNEQFDDLMDRLSIEEFEKYVGIVRDQELAGKHYRKKTHYQAIIDMAKQDRRLA